MESEKLIIIGILFICIILSSGINVNSLLIGMLLGFIIFGYLFNGTDYVSIATEYLENLINNKNKFVPKLVVKNTKDEFEESVGDKKNTQDIAENIKNNSNLDLINDPLIYKYDIEEKKNIKENTFYDNYPGNINSNTKKCNDNAFIDGDETIAYNNIVRNEPTRVIIGMTEAYKKLNKYVREEVEEAEYKDWWDDTTY
jgi:hypothetical protein